MESLSAQSCDSNWSPGFSQWDSSGMSYKIVEMQKLAIYCVDMKHSEIFSNLPFSELAVRKKTKFKTVASILKF